MIKRIALALTLTVACAAHAAEPTLGQKFAAIADGHFHAADSSEAKEAITALNAAARKFETTPEAIANLVVVGYNESKRNHFRYSMYDVAEALPVMEDRERSTEDRAKKIMVMYLTARVSGQNHSEAFAGVRKLIETVNP